MSFDMDLTSLPEGLTEVALIDADGYQDALPPAPPQPGNYRLRIIDASLQTDGSGTTILDDGKYAQLKVQSVEIIDPVESQRKLFIFQKFPSRPYRDRKGASKLTDLIRAHDVALTWTDNTDAFRVLNQTVEQGSTFCCYLDWVAKDSLWLRDEIDRLGGTMDRIDNDERTRIFSAWHCQGKKNFPVDDHGKAIPMWEGPSGEKIEARCEVVKLYKSSREPKIISV